MLSTRAHQLKSMPLKAHCEMFEALYMPRTQEELDEYFDVAGVLLYKFMEPTTPFTLTYVMDQRRHIVDALVGARDESHLEARVAGMLGHARAQFIGAFRALSAGVLAWYARPSNGVDANGQEVFVERSWRARPRNGQDFTERFQSLTVGDDRVTLVYAKKELFWDMQHAYEYLMHWAKFPKTEEERAHLRMVLITNWIPLARTEVQHGTPNSSRRLTGFKEVLAVLTGHDEITDAIFEGLFNNGI